MRPRLIIGPLLMLSAVALMTTLPPHASAQELPPEMQVDRLLVQAEREIEDGQHWSAVFTFERILAVCEEYGLEIPTEFWFRQAGVLQTAGLHERAVEASTRYLQEAGREGAHYRAALEHRRMLHARRSGRVLDAQGGARQSCDAKGHPLFSQLQQLRCGREPFRLTSEPMAAMRRFQDAYRRQPTDSPVASREWVSERSTSPL